MPKPPMKFETKESCQPAAGPVIVAKPNTPEWYQARREGIGASEVAVAVGLSPWSTPAELYYRKRGELPDIQENDAMRLGRLLEPVVKSEFVHRTGLQFADANPPMAKNPRFDGIFATPDGIVCPGELFEGKTASFRMRDEWGEEGTDDIPKGYVLQCQAQLAVWCAEMVHVGVLIDGSNFRYYRVLRNDELIRLIIEAATELWLRIKEGRPPEPDWTHPATPDLIREMNRTVNDIRVRLLPQDVEAWAEYESKTAQSEKLKKEAKAAKAKVEYSLGENFAGLLPDGRMVRRKMIEVAGYTVETKTRMDVRAVKYDNGPITERLT